MGPTVTTELVAKSPGKMKASSLFIFAGSLFVLDLVVDHYSRSWGAGPSTVSTLFWASLFLFGVGLYRWRRPGSESQSGASAESHAISREAASRTRLPRQLILGGGLLLLVDILCLAPFIATETSNPGVFARIVSIVFILSVVIVLSGFVLGVVRMKDEDITSMPREPRHVVPGDSIVSLQEVQRRSASPDVSAERPMPPSEGESVFRKWATFLTVGMLFWLTGLVGVAMGSDSGVSFEFYVIWYAYLSAMPLSIAAMIFALIKRESGQVATAILFLKVPFYYGCVCLLLFFTPGLIAVVASIRAGTMDFQSLGASVLAFSILFGCIWLIMWIARQVWSFWGRNSS